VRNHLFIGDTQVKPGVPLDHIEALGKFILDRKPDVIVHAGDNWDMPSLSSYDEGKRAMEGRRYEEDIEAGNEAMRIIDAAIESDPSYNPECYFLIGNHEQRIERYVEENPKLEGYMSYDDFELDNWQVIPFLHILELDGIHYSHYFSNPFSGRPYGGSAVTKLNKLKFSFAMGHVQKLEYHKDFLNNGKSISGLVNGAFYMHDEDYKGPQGNNHWRGLTLLNGVTDGDYDLETIRLERLLAEYHV
tara:strand:+ start:9080 stop:9817 length:738 start_codon:yes stop_codon:yes gene_type:complete